VRDGPAVQVASAVPDNLVVPAVLIASAVTNVRRAAVAEVPSVEQAVLLRKQPAVAVALAWEEEEAVVVVAVAVAAVAVAAVAVAAAEEEDAGDEPA